MTGYGRQIALLPCSTIQRVSNVFHPIPPVPFQAKYIYTKAIGSGGEANCDRYEVDNGSRAYAVKTVVRPSPHTNYLHEADILVSLQPKHPLVIEVEEVFQDEQLRIVMPLYSGGDLTALLHKFKLFNVKLPEAYAWHLFSQLADALHYLHTNQGLPVLHRDLKPENVLIDLTDHSHLFDSIKIIDFGMATTNMEPHDHRAGTPKYQPPESPRASKAADVWAVGGIMHFLLTGNAPKPECPTEVQDNDRHAWYSKAPAQIQHLVDSEHANYSADDQTLALDEAREATHEHHSPLPKSGYSPLLDHWLKRALDLNHNNRATTTELITDMAYDARKQIDFYIQWIAVSGIRRPMCGCAYPEPPPGWRPE